MCDKCENQIDGQDLDDHEIAGIALAIIGGMIEGYCEEGYCDPTMYQALEMAEKLARKMNETGLAERLTIAKIFAGETINTLIAEHEAEEAN
jgi:hypothetical protein